MRFWRRPAIGLVGQVFAILLLTLLIEFGASTLLYERASRFAVRDDEANRLDEHLVISRRLLNERPAAQSQSLHAEPARTRPRRCGGELSPLPPPRLGRLGRLEADVALARDVARAMLVELCLNLEP